MVNFDVRQLNAARKYSGEINFTLSCGQEIVTLPLTELVGNVEVSGNYEIFEDDSVEFKGTARYLLRGACSRCLKPAEKWVTAEWDPVFVKGESDGENYGYQKGVIDLTESVKDAVMLSMPYTLLCREDCEGIPFDGSDDN